MFRHQENHLPVTLVKAAEGRELVAGGKLLDQVQGLVGKALESLERAEGKGNEREVQGAIREARHSLELVGRLNGELKESREIKHSGTVEHLHGMTREDLLARNDQLMAMLGPVVIEGEARPAIEEVQDEEFKPVED